MAKLIELPPVYHDYWGMPGSANETIKEMIEPGFHLERNILILKLIIHQFFDDGSSKVAFAACRCDAEGSKFPGPLELGDRHAA
jgi:hypothetical protein